MSPQIWEDLSGAILDGRYRLETLTYSGRNQAEFHAIAGERVTVTLMALRREEMEQVKADLWNASRLEHPHLLRILDVGRWSNGGSPFLYVVAERAEETLAQLLRAGPLSASAARNLLLDVIAALAYLHDQGLVYRGLDPETTVRIGGRWKLADLGQACPIGASGGPIARSAHNPPEAGAARALPSWDVWAIGALLRQALGQEGPEPAPVEGALGRVIARCLDPQPGRRPSLDQLRTMLLAEKATANAAQPAIEAVVAESRPEFKRPAPPGLPAQVEVSRGRKRTSGPATHRLWTPRSRTYIGLGLLAIGVAALMFLSPGPQGRRSAGIGRPGPEAATAPGARSSPARGLERPRPMEPSALSGRPPADHQPLSNPRPVAGSRESRRRPAAVVGLADYVSRIRDGQRTASGERFESGTLTAAHASYPFGTRLRVVNLENRRSVIVRVNDRGHFSSGRIIHLTERAARELGLARKGWARVRLEPVD